VPPAANFANCQNYTGYDFHDAYAKLNPDKLQNFVRQGKDFAPLSR
jgi:hypothetical protein